MANYSFTQEFFDGLQEMDKVRVKMMAAPAGYGKTTAMKLWLGAVMDRVPIYVTLNGPNTKEFWSDFCAALERPFPKLAVALSDLGFPRGEQEYGYAVEFMKEHMDMPCSIILEDLHLLNDAEILPLLQYWIDHLDDTVDFMLLSEREPALKAEDSAVLTTAHLPMPHRDLWNDLRGKLWEPLDERQKRFLAVCSIADTVNEEQMDFVWENFDGEILFQELLIDFDFVSGRNGEYRIHDMLRDLAEDHFRRFDRETQIRYFRRFALWFKDHGNVVMALLCAYQGGDWDLYWEILAADGGKSVTEEYAALFTRWSRECPESVMKEHPEGLLGLMFVCYRYRQGMEMFRLRRTLDELLGGDALEEKRKDQIRAEKELLLGLADFNDIISMAQHFETAASLAERCSIVDSASYWSSACPSLLAMYHSTAGGLDAELDAMDRAMAAYTKLTDGHGSGAAKLCRAEAAYLRGDLASAKELHLVALTEGMEHRQYDIVLGALFLGMRICLFEGDTAKAAEHLESIETLVKKQGLGGLMCALDVCRAWFYAQTGQVEDIPEWMLGDRALFFVPYPAAPFFQCTINQVLMAQGNWLRLVGRKNEFAKLFEYNHALLNSVYLHAQLIAGMDDFDRADNAQVELNIALDMGAPDGLVMPFKENMKHIRSYLESHLEGEVYGDFIRKTLS
ncbi:MAG: hypothetical protein IIY02_00255 [Firmicutes bacterium]|nr:hypothetical protein [Bacillota bacterium]